MMLRNDEVALEEASRVVVLVKYPDTALKFPKDEPRPTDLVVILASDEDPRWYRPAKHGTWDWGVRSVTPTGPMLSVLIGETMLEFTTAHVHASVVLSANETRILADHVIRDFPKQVAQHKAGKSTFGFLVGQVLKRSAGKADPRWIAHKLALRLEQA